MKGLRHDCEQALGYVRQSHMDHVRSLGVSPEALAHLGQYQLPFGMLPICTDDANRWWPDYDEGRPAMVIPVYERGDLIDMVALSTTAPTRWFWREGCAEMLGYDVLNDVWPIGPLHVVTTPIGWIAAAGRAVCILDWCLPDHELSPMRDRERLVCDTPLLAARLRKHLSRPRKMPPISIYEGGAHVAAA